MGKKEVIKIFEEKKVRTVWDDVEEKWYFSIVDVCGVLTESKDALTARKYWNKLKQRLKEEGNETVTNCHQLKLKAADGKMRLTDVADMEQLFRLKRIMGLSRDSLEERAIRLAKQIGEIMLLKQRMDEETRLSYFAKVKDEKGGVHFLDIYYLENSEASIIESKDLKGLENYEEDSEYRYYREIIQEWMQRYREAAAKGLSFEGSDIATI